MNAITHGMDPQAVQRLAAELGKQQARIAAVRQDVHLSLRLTPWQGLDAAAFTDDWITRLAPALAGAEAALAAAADHLVGQVNEQVAASGDAALGGSPVALGWTGGMPVRQVAPSSPIDIGLRFGEWLWNGSVRATAQTVGSAALETAKGVADWGDAVTAAGQRHWDAWEVFGSNLAGIPSGDIPAPAEFLGSLVLLGATNLGVAANATTGTDHKIFDQGTPWVGEVSGRQSVPPPASITDLILSGQQSVADEALGVIATTGADGVVRFVVSVPSTDADVASIEGWNGDPNGRSWDANVWQLSSGTSTGMQAAELATLKAIEDYQARNPDANVGDPPQVLLSGHSQGGLSASNMAADSAFNQQVSVMGVVDFAGPGDCADVPADVPTLAIAHGTGNPVESLLRPAGSLGDLIPKLDLGGNPGTPENLTKVYLAPVGDGVDIRNNHEIEDYVTSMSTVEAQAELNRWVEQNPEVERFLTGSHAERITVEFGQR